MKLFARGGPHARARPLPSRIVYPLVGMALALALTIGLAAVRAIDAGRSLDLAWLRVDLAASGITYVYVSLSTSVVFLFIGHALGEREDRLWTTSTTDPLTRVANRRMFEHALAEELARARASRMPLSLLVVDLDHLKTINDACGHAAGDAALRALAEVIRGSTRARDLTARFGGDEFVIVVPRTRATEAWAVAERIRAALAARWAASPAARRGAKVPSLTVSIGIADLESARERGPDALFEAADRALYQAKTGGRDRTVIASQLEDTLVSVVVRPSDGSDADEAVVAPVAARCDDAPAACERAVAIAPCAAVAELDPEHASAVLAAGSARNAATPSTMPPPRASAAYARASRHRGGDGADPAEDDADAGRAAEAARALEPAASSGLVHNANPR